MLSVLAKVFKRRKPAFQLTEPEDRDATLGEIKSDSHAELEKSEKMSNCTAINAEVLDRERTFDKSAPLTAENSNSNPIRDIVFIDGAITQISELLRELDPQAEIHVLDQQNDGVDQIVAHLAGRQELLAIHLFCHGDSGVLNLGNGQITTDTISNIHSQAFSQIGAALSQDGEILIYGCDFCAGEIGRAAAAQLAMITGAEIAASTEILSESKFEWVGIEKPEITAPPIRLIPDEEITRQSRKTELSYSVLDGEPLDITAEDGLLHRAGLAGGTLKSATDGSGAAIKLNEPGVSVPRTHLLPNGAVLTQYANGAFAYQSETDAGDGELFTCLAVGPDQSLAKFTVSIGAIRSEETAGESVKVSDEKSHGNSAGEAGIFPMSAQVEPQAGHKGTINSASPLSINVPNTSAGPTAETTTMVDAPLIFLQRSKNSISVKGSENDVIVLTLTASSGALNARPIKGALVDGYNSEKLTITGSMKQINAALDGLRYVNSTIHGGPAEIVASAKYERDSSETAVIESVAVSVVSMAYDPVAEITVESDTSDRSSAAEAQFVVASVPAEPQSSPADAPTSMPVEAQTTVSDEPFVVEFTAPIGAVVTIANAGDTLKLTEGELQIAGDGTFSLSLKDGYTSADTRVTCCIGGQGGEATLSTETILDLSLVPIDPEKGFKGNVFSGAEYIVPMRQDATVASIERPKNGVSDAAINEPEIASASIQYQPEHKDLPDAQISLAIEDRGPLAMPTEGKDLIVSSAPVALADHHHAVPLPDEFHDRTKKNTKTEFEKWDVEELSGHSLHFSFDRKGRQKAITPTMQMGQIAVDTYIRHQTLFLDVNSTFDPQEHGKVEFYHIELSDGSSKPRWMREIRNGFYSMELPNPCGATDLKVSAMMQNGNEYSCAVNIDEENGTITPVSNNYAPKQFYSQAQASNGLSSELVSP